MLYTPSTIRLLCKLGWAACKTRDGALRTRALVLSRVSGSSRVSSLRVCIHARDTRAFSTRFFLLHRSASTSRESLATEWRPLCTYKTRFVVAWGVSRTTHSRLLRDTKTYWKPRKNALAKKKIKNLRIAHCLGKRIVHKIRTISTQLCLLIMVYYIFWNCVFFSLNWLCYF